MKTRNKTKDTGSVVAQDNKGRAGRFVFRRLVTNVLDTQPTIEESKKSFLNRKRTTRIVQWNLRSLTGDGKGELLVGELKRYNI